MAKINPARLSKIKRVAHLRQPDITVVLENIHDTHNIGAVLRSADSVGLREVYVLNTDPLLSKSEIKLGKRTSSGARKWLDVHLYRDREACFAALSAKYQNLFGASVQEGGQCLYALDLTQPTALIFGNEHAGLTPATLARCTGTFTIPQKGMTESLNISVACAVSLFEALRQRELAGFYTNHPGLNDQDKAKVLDDYLDRHSSGYKAHSVEAVDQPNLSNS